MTDDIEAKVPSAMQKTTFTVLGICCGSEAALVQKILNPLEGIENISVNVLAKTTTVIHDPSKISASQIVNALNKAKLKAGIRELGQVKTRKQSRPNANVIASGVLLLVAMFSYIYQPLVWVSLASIAIGILDMLRRCIAALGRCVLDINVLMVIAVFGAVGLGNYLEGASVVFLFTLAQWLEAKSSDKAQASLESLMNLAPRTAVIAETGETVDVKDITINTLVSVKAGERVPVDGLVVTGGSTIDESSLTGEFMPVDKEVGSKVWAGSVVLTGFINVATKALEEDSAVARMVKLVEDAQSRRSNIEEFIEKFAKYYTPGVVLIAAGIAVVPWALSFQDIRHWIYLSLVLLVVACPCALVISTPVAKVCGLSAAAKMGLIIKGGNHLEALAKIKALAFDKTGTLTEGSFKVVDMQLVEQKIDINQLLYWISSLENLSGHPIAKALVEYARFRGIQPSREVKDFKMISGEGISAYVDDCLIQIGNAQLAFRNGWLSESKFYIDEAGITVGYVGMDNHFIGYFRLGDQVRGEAAQAVHELQKQRIQVTILTGDSKAAAELIQKQIGENIKVEASLAPEDKMKKIAELKEKWGLTAMVGDGINDAPALAASDIGIAMGVAGSAVATETADVALMSNDLRKIPEAVKLARATLRKNYQNVALSLAVKLLFLGLAFGGMPSLWAAVVADMGTCLAVIFNSMLLLRKHKKEGSIAFDKSSEQLHVRVEPGLDSECSRNLQENLEGLHEPLLPPKEREEKEERPRSCCKGCRGGANGEEVDFR
ncbi:cadmium/zinc-transporting ATPase HMA2-like [Phoenix dactylifera]|uniref:Cd(2+)-exporting ATPase n=1 Tax=Phoenix dactylifera TaxID=42345 RepID=A0A8B7CX62_PHODC|nr:cadmium/zinc-transporting ATPase HMA2-like [Phoenix dactylifera]XP_008808280.1 cadmium/zinc-transporting ATPase HMA2-like [Phoenix dactylifera]XP_008808281.1 cadmium/zinc-transporting ATPase HMA2-like [Phoenix dactylifera]XP_026665522.1 cadmium/zinc-transporting ATPase HMA2-like [Phoenix dactylifera]